MTKVEGLRLLKNIIVICTRNRRDDLQNALASVNTQTVSPDYVLIVDSSDAFIELRNNFNFSFVHIKSAKNLTFQRNVALSHLKSFSQYSLIHFFDDDVILGPNYIDLISQDFIRFPDVSGICARTPGIKTKKPNLYKRIFLLDSESSGKVLSSGINVPFRNDHGVYEVEWLPGCCMSYRLSAITGRSFDEGRTGVGWGEDVDFSYRLSLDSKLICDPHLEIVHKMSMLNRDSFLTQYVNVILNRLKLQKIPGSKIKTFSIFWAILGEIPMLLGIKTRLCLQKLLTSED